MSTNLLDLITQRLNGFRSEIGAMELKLATQRDTFTAQIASLQDRARNLEAINGDLTSELEIRLAAHTELKGRVDVLVGQLTALGVDAGI
ncbi:MAG: hypothetical protein CTY20_07835 [Hyphomicrobium sp.]|nr:MAG: hypothetical protein CTY20_07835 [Hyphomicrobium sp.]